MRWTSRTLISGHRLRLWLRTVHDTPSRGALLTTQVLGQTAPPDPARTPGGLNPEVTQATIGSTICVRAWTRTVRPPQQYTAALKRQQIRQLRWWRTEATE